ncbi:hypothetical protein [Paenibacillus odorifer]|uniref:hypothetical protein n=1 Tax=Paenibacillus odorifer TaxID=189426 RepID=UPI0011319383|nr:hypothetical protein [Paenibacillus odorifer]
MTFGTPSVELFHILITALSNFPLKNSLSSLMVRISALAVTASSDFNLPLFDQSILWAVTDSLPP